MLMNGADALLRSLEAEGVETVFGIPGGAILPTYDALARGTTIRHVLARHEQGAGHMAQGFARASGRVGVAFATSGPGGHEPGDADRRRLDGLDAARLRDRAGAVAPDRHRRLPGVRHHRHHDPDRQALVARPGRGRAAARDQGRVPRRQHRALRPGPRRHPARRPGGGDRLQLPGRDRSARLAPGRDREREAGSGRSAGDRRRAAARPLRRRRDDQRRGLRRASRARGAVAAPGGDDADGEELVPGDARPPLRLAGHARRQVVELGDEQVRRARRGRGALRRPRHRQALRVRAGRDRRPPRRRRRRDREAAAGGHPGRRAAEADPRRARERVRGAEGRRASAPRPTPGSPSSPAGARSSRSATATTATC